MNYNIWVLFDFPISGKRKTKQEHYEIPHSASLHYQ